MQILNKQARAIFLHRHGLTDTPQRLNVAALADLIGQLGFVQLDSINTLARAHDMILHARSHGYSPAQLKSLHEDRRELWEHWTHDAALLPIGTYPHWHHRFAQNAARLGTNHAAEMARVMDHIAAKGAVRGADLAEGRRSTKGGWWDWSPSKTALEWLWRTGKLAISGRSGFQKTYDLAERVIPAPLLGQRPEWAETVDWAARGALSRLGFATAREVAAFYALISPQDAKAWLARAAATGEVAAVQVQGADGSFRAGFALAGTAEAPPPPPRLRLLSPFDPMLRDRARAAFLFGFDYRIEVFVPEAQRRFGYYVFPVLEGDQMIARIDVKAHRGEGALRVRALWPEAGVRFGAQRQARLAAALQKLVTFSGCARLEFAPDWLRGGAPAA